jgi:hypothetical protein
MLPSITASHSRRTATLRVAVAVVLAFAFATTASLALQAPSVATAATVELTAPVQASFDAAVAKADASSASKLKLLYRDLGSLVEQDQSTEAKIKSLHYRNEEALIAVRKQIRDIDAAKIDALDAKVKQVKDRYKPLFTAYTAVNQQISAAKYLKNKTLNAMLRAEADGMKPAILIAREDIKSKEAALKSAKDAAAKRIKAARDLLATIDPIEVQIRAERSAAGLPRKSLSPAWTNFKHALKTSETRGTQDSLGTLVALSSQIVEQQQKIFSLETKIGDIIVRTRTLIL